MLNLTRQERIVVTFLIINALIGLGVVYFKKTHPQIDTKIASSHLKKEEDRRSSGKIFPININTAGTEQFILLPGIGPALAKRIIDYRELNGPFNKVDEIKHVKGVGPKKFSKIKDYLALE